LRYEPFISSLEYWKILNKGQKKKQPNISIDVLYEFFKNLNGASDHDDVELSVCEPSIWNFTRIKNKIK
jgi:hypothetical protein